TCDSEAQPGDLLLNEFVSNNEGAWVDQTGETDAWPEIINVSSRTIDLSDFTLTDGKNEAGLPQRTLAPGGRTLIWLDDEPEEGDDHMPFKLSSDGETVSILSCGTIIDEVDVPALSDN